MSDWITLTLADLQEARVAKLIESLRTKALASGQADPMQGAVDKAVGELRAAIGFSGKYRLDATPGTIPPSLHDLAVQRVVRLLQGRLLMELSPEQVEDKRTYEKRLEQLNVGKWPIEQPAAVAASPVQSTEGGCEIARRPPSVPNRSALDRLL